MKTIAIAILPLLLMGCTTPHGLSRLQGVWVVDADATVREQKLRPVPRGVWKEAVEPENLSKIRYEFSGNLFRSFSHKDELGSTEPVHVYAEDDSFVILLTPPLVGKWSSSHPPVQELWEADPIGGWDALRGLLMFEFTGPDRARLFHVGLDAKRKMLPVFTGIHLIRTNREANN